MDLAGTVGLAVVVFASTNVDDIFLLLLYFADRETRAGHVVAGQYLGVGALVAVSVLGAAASQALPDDYVGLLGIAPILLGIRGLLDLRSGDGGVAPPEAPRQPRPAGARTLSVAAVTVANGGDNIGVYVPLFASIGAARASVTIAVFAVMVMVWCGVAFWLVHHSAAGPRIRRYGHVVLPFVLIGLGVYILTSHTAIF